MWLYQRSTGNLQVRDPSASAHIRTGVSVLIWLFSWYRSGWVQALQAKLAAHTGPTLRVDAPHKS
eukprot:3940833-Rhodomonas_salina.1